MLSKGKPLSMEEEANREEPPRRAVKSEQPAEREGVTPSEDLEVHGEGKGIPVGGGDPYFGEKHLIAVQRGRGRSL